MTDISPGMESDFCTYETQAGMQLHPVAIGGSFSSLRL